MSPELVNELETDEFNPELCDVYSLGMSFLRITL